MHNNILTIIYIAFAVDAVRRVKNNIVQKWKTAKTQMQLGRSKQIYEIVSYLSKYFSK